MKILKDGVKEKRWVGQCRECSAIAMADIDELGEIERPNENEENDYAKGTCPYCENEDVAIFFKRIRSTQARQLLRKHGLKTIYKKEE